LELTSDQPWKPYSNVFTRREEAAQEIESLIRVEDVPYGDAMEGIEESVEDEATGERMPSWWEEPEELAVRLVESVKIAGYQSAGLVEPEAGSGDQRRETGALETREKTGAVTASQLAQRWMIGLGTAEKTLQVTTQRGVRRFVHHSDRRVKTHLPHLTFGITRQRFYTDTLFSKIPSIHKDVCAQLWTDGQGYAEFYPLKTKQAVPTTIPRFIHDLGAIPETVASDGSGEQTGEEWREELHRYRIQHELTEPYSPWQNLAELEVREFKRGI
jgi:hypothetical protein